MSSRAARILVMRFSSLGDVVLASSLLEILADRDDRPEIALATKAAYGPLFAGDPRLSRLELLDERGFGDLLRRLEDFDPDWILDAHASLRSRLLCALLPPTRVSRIAKDAWQRLAFVYGRFRTPALERHQLERYAAMLSSGPRHARLIVSATARSRAEELWSGSNALAIAPGARHASKRWPRERFAEVARRFADAHDCELLILGSESERELCADLSERIGDRARDLCARCDLDVLAALLERCGQLLCNDSGLMHLAEAVGTPVTALFGPTAREFGFFPRHPASQVIEHALPCRPCSRTGSRDCRMPERWCMTRSTPELVHSQLELQWKRLREAAI